MTKPLTFPLNIPSLFQREVNCADTPKTTYFGSTKLPKRISGYLKRKKVIGTYTLTFVILLSSLQITVTDDTRFYMLYINDHLVEVTQSQIILSFNDTIK